MALMQPVVVGPLSELSSSVRVRGQLPGSTVTVQAVGPSPRVVAKGVATSGDQRFSQLGGASLSRKDVLYAVQETGGETSDFPSGNQGMPVAPGPASSADLGRVNIATHPYACGKFVWINGALPGADVTVLASGPVLGSGKANEGIARVSGRTSEGPRFAPLGAASCPPRLRAWSSRTDHGHRSRLAQGTLSAAGLRGPRSLPSRSTGRRPPAGRR